VEYVASLPPALKIRRLRMKYILRRAFRDLLPPALLNRKKHGFGVPLGHWFRHRLRSYVEDTLLAPQARSRAYFNPSVVRALFQEHVDGVRSHWDRLWVLLTFELWLRMLEAGDFWTPRQPSAADGIEVTAATRQSYA
jgi:asparagine synthase (glutamine-hydrolysing)